MADWAVIHRETHQLPWQVIWCYSEARAKERAKELIETRQATVVYLAEERFLVQHTGVTISEVL